MASHSTVFLTEQEAERIRTTVKDRLKRCSAAVGHPREPREPKGAIQQATGASLMADMGGAPDPDMSETKERGVLPALAVGDMYPPCVLSIKDLQPMRVADLRMETHHRGRHLTIKRVSPVVTLVARSWTMVQDDAGDGTDTERLEICLHKSRHYEDVLESSKTFVIKEPYFTFTDQGEATIRIDHPSDLVIFANKPTSQAQDTAKTAQKCKKEGNAALKDQDLPLAHAKYTDGLEAANKSDPDLARDISRNRAHVNLLLWQLDEAKNDAKAALIGADQEDQRSKELDGKAFFRAGCAAYNLGEYKEAKAYFEAQQKLLPGDKDARANLRKIETRFREQAGTYDLGSIRAGLTQMRSRTDAANFISKTQIKHSPSKGRGLFATQNIAAGEIVMCEKAFCVAWAHEERDVLTAITYDVRDDRIRVSPVGLSKVIVQRLLSNPSQTAKLMDLYGDWQGGDSAGIFSTKDGPIVDVFRVHDIVSRNAFGLGSQNGVSTGLWLQAAYINHSCIPNTSTEFIGDLMVLRATRPIAASEELSIRYDGSGSNDYDTRQAALMNTWGFECNCGLCAAERADDLLVRKKRLDLASQADTFVDKEHWADAKRLSIRSAQRLARAINETYDDERYKDVPREAVRTIEDWLTKASPRR